MISNRIVKWGIVFYIIIALFTVSKLYAQDESSSGGSLGRYYNVYFYPVSLIASIASMFTLNSLFDDSEQPTDTNEKNEGHKEGKFLFANIYTTFELLVSDPFTIVITPSYQGWNYRFTGHDDKGNMNHDRIGSDLGVRLYTEGKPEGFFLQATGGMYYFKRNLKYLNDPIETAKYRAILYQGMGYAGYVLDDFCVSFGAGYNYYKDRSLSYQYDSERTNLTKSLALRGLTFDVAFSCKLSTVKK